MFSPNHEAVRQKLLKLEQELNEMVMERRDITRGLILALLASETNAPIPVILVGPPGTAKTALIKALCSAIGGKFFSWLMNPTTLPEEIFGPIRTTRMVEHDEVLRNPAGKLPEADVVYLDETFNGNESTLNLLLPVLADGEWYNGPGAEPMHLRLFVGSTNRVPDISGDQPMLAALWDRFVVRFLVDYLKERANFTKMLEGVVERRRSQQGNRLVPTTTLTLDEIESVKQVVRSVDVSGILDTLYELREAAGRIGIPVSDRRWGQYIALIQAQAFLSGRSVAQNEDLVILQHCLWNSPEEAREARKLVMGYLHPWFEELQELLDDAEEQIYRFRTAPSSEDDQVAFMTVVAEVNTKLKSIIRDIENMINAERGRTGNVPEEMKEALTKVRQYNQEVVRKAMGFD